MSNLSSFAPPVESRVLGSVTTPPGASPLAGHPDCVPLTMSGDAWESAANHVIAIRQKAIHNADAWRQIGEFLQSLPRRSESCLFPQPPHGRSDFPVGTGTEFLLPRGYCELRLEFGMEYPIDAPSFLPLGGSVALPRFGRIGSFESVTCSRESFR